MLDSKIKDPSLSKVYVLNPFSKPFSKPLLHLLCFFFGAKFHVRMFAFSGEVQLQSPEGSSALLILLADHSSLYNLYNRPRSIPHLLKVGPHTKSKHSIITNTENNHTNPALLPVSLPNNSGHCCCRPKVPEVLNGLSRSCPESSWARSRACTRNVVAVRDRCDENPNENG
jgi:hypothetical protein